MKASFRTEGDSLGKMHVPRDAVHGIHTARALDNFPITDVRLSHFPELVRALAMVVADLFEVLPEFEKSS